MSVLVADLEVYEYICCGLKYAAVNKTCDDLYSSSVSQHMKNKDWEEESLRLTKVWCRLNIECFDIQYKDKDVDNGLSMETFLTGRRIVHLQAVQLLKYVECVSYNIALNTIKKVRQLNAEELADLQLLHTWKREIMEAILHQLEEYKSAAWSEGINMSKTA